MPISRFLFVTAEWSSIITILSPGTMAISCNGIGGGSNTGVSRKSLRHMRILAPLGSEGPIDRPGRNLDVDARDWSTVCMVRYGAFIPLPDRAVDKAYLAANARGRTFGRNRRTAQYHTENARRIAKARGSNAPHWSSAVLGLTGGLCALYIALYALGILPKPDIPQTDLVLGAITLLTALFRRSEPRWVQSTPRGISRPWLNSPSGPRADWPQSTKSWPTNRWILPGWPTASRKHRILMMVDLEEWQTVSAPGRCRFRRDAEMRRDGHEMMESQQQFRKTSRDRPSVRARTETDPCGSMAAACGRGLRCFA